MLAQQATTTGTQGCSAHSVPDAAKFNEVAPPVIDTDQWCNAIASFGGKYATIVAKHMCGFAIWDTKVRTSTLPSLYACGTSTLPSLPLT